MGKHYSGSPAPSTMTHGAGPDCDDGSELLGPGPGARAKRVKPKQAENPGESRKPKAEDETSVEREGKGP